ncbi:MAG: hypothetical protein HQK50_14470 [Oligoflexia bacterium]|nr:hypothetical protein [Oligoflexia bacterium]
MALEKCKSYGIDSFIKAPKEYHEQALSGFTTEDMSKASKAGVSESDIAKFKKELPDATIAEIIEMSKSGVDPDDASDFKEAVPETTIAEILEMQKAGVDLYDASVFKKSAPGTTIAEIIEMSKAGVNFFYASVFEKEKPNITLAEIIAKQKAQEKNESCFQVYSLPSQPQLPSFMLSSEMASKLTCLSIGQIIAVNGGSGKAQTAIAVPATTKLSYTNQEKKTVSITYGNLKDEAKKLLPGNKILYWGTGAGAPKDIEKRVSSLFMRGRTKKGLGTNLDEHTGEDKKKEEDSSFHPTSEKLEVALKFARQKKGGLLFWIDPHDLKNSMISVPRFYEQVGRLAQFSESEVLLYKKIPKQSFIAAYSPVEKIMFVRTTQDEKGNTIVSDLAKEALRQNIACMNYIEKVDLLQKYGMDIKAKQEINEDIISKLLETIITKSK